MRQKKQVLFSSKFSRSNTHDPDWVMDNQMEPNAIWLMESFSLGGRGLGCGLGSLYRFYPPDRRPQIRASEY